MTLRMLIDARHREETRVAVVKGNRIEEFDFESAEHKQLKGNIYLAKVTRVEPSLQAAFVEYGGNRHGFLALSEIHPDYYQIPVADRQALIAEEERAHRAADAEVDRRAARSQSAAQPAERAADEVRTAPVTEEVVEEAAEDATEENGPGGGEPVTSAAPESNPEKDDPEQPSLEQLSDRADQAVPVQELAKIEQRSEPALEIARAELDSPPQQLLMRTATRRPTDDNLSAAQPARQSPAMETSA